MHYADVFCLLGGRHGVEKVLAVDAISEIVVDGEISDSKAGEVLEKVRSLTGIHSVILQTGFDDDARSGDVWPFDGDA